jgi:hypothetical protein
MWKFIEIWTPGNTVYTRQFLPTFISLVYVTWWLENKWCQINRWLGLLVTSFLPCTSAIIKPWHRVFRVTLWIHDSRAPQWDEEKPVLLGEFQTPVAQSPVDNSNHGAWQLGQAVCFKFRNLDEFRSTMFCCCPCLCFPQATLNWESFHTNQGHLPPASSIDWFGCHSNSQAEAA